MTRFFASIFTLLAMFSNPLTAAPLTTAQIEQAWAGIQQQTGRFVQQYDDGSTASGNYYAVDATLIIMTYDSVSGIVVMSGTDDERVIDLPDGRRLQVAGKQIFVIDPGFETNTTPLGVFARLLSKQPNIDELVTGSGDNSAVTVVRLRHPNAQRRGYVDLTFSNTSRQLVKWESDIDGEHVVTVFE